MKLLLISHNVLNKNTNTGRTLLNQFQGFGADEIAQLYFNKGKPEATNCEDFFCISDSDLLASLLTRRPAGYSFRASDLQDYSDTRCSQEPIKTVIRKQAQSQWMYVARNAVWFLGKWRTKALDDWLEKINPDVIFFASGDYAFSYAVTQYIASKRNIPVIIGCYDDFYLGKIKNQGLLYHLVHADLVRHAKQLFQKSCGFLAMSEMMTADYAAAFHQTGHTMYVPTEISENAGADVRSNTMLYAGNLGLGRAEQLVALGRALKALNRSDISYIDVYSGEVRESLTSLMCEENGIRFHGHAAPDLIKEKLCSSQFVIHTESFEEKNKTKVRYSVSTKIADCLTCGACIIAFGPEDIASISYLKEHQAAYVMSSPEQLARQLNTILDDAGLCHEIIQNARELSGKNHDPLKSSIRFKEQLISCFQDAGRQ